MSMNVLDYLVAAIPETLIQPDERRDLESMPIASTCGEDCRVAIEVAAGFARLIRLAHGPFADQRVQPVGASAKDLCLLYICG